MTWLRAKTFIYAEHENELLNMLDCVASHEIILHPAVPVLAVGDMNGATDEVALRLFSGKDFEFDGSSAFLVEPSDTDTIIEHVERCMPHCSCSRLVEVGIEFASPTALKLVEKRMAQQPEVFGARLWISKR